MFPSYRDGRAELPTTPSTGVTWPTFPSLAELTARHEQFRAHALHVLGCSPSTVRWYQNGLASLLAFLSKQPAVIPVVITPGILERWIASLRERQISGHTLRTYWNSLKRFVRAVVRQDLCTDPFLYVRTPGAPAHIYKALAPAECERVLATAMNYPWRSLYEQTRNTAMLATALYAGLRKSEILRLHVTDVDLKEGSIHVERGKGRHGGKSRTAYAPAELRQIIEKYLHQRQLRRLTAPELFVSLITGRGVSPEALKNVVERIRRASGVRFSLHVLRHSYVTMLLRSGVPIHVAKELAGHADIKTTEGYARVFSEDMRRHAEAVRFDSRGTGSGGDGT